MKGIVIDKCGQIAHQIAHHIVKILLRHLDREIHRKGERTRNSHELWNWWEEAITFTSQQGK